VRTSERTAFGAPRPPALCRSAPSGLSGFTSSGSVSWVSFDGQGRALPPRSESPPPLRLGAQQITSGSTASGSAWSRPSSFCAGIAAARPCGMPKCLRPPAEGPQSASGCTAIRPIQKHFAWQGLNIVYNRFVAANPCSWSLNFLRTSRMGGRHTRFRSFGAHSTRGDSS